MTADDLKSMPFMKCLASCLSRMVSEGYTENFSITEEGMNSQHSHNHFQPGEIQVVNSYCFEAQSGPNDNAILYVIETSDGTKGTLKDAGGNSGSSNVSRFMKDVETIQKKL